MKRKCICLVAFLVITIALGVSVAILAYLKLNLNLNLNPNPQQQQQLLLQQHHQQLLQQHHHQLQQQKEYIRDKLHADARLLRQSQDQDQGGKEEWSGAATDAGEIKVQQQHPINVLASSPVIKIDGGDKFGPVEIRDEAEDADIKLESETEEDTDDH